MPLPPRAELRRDLARMDPVRQKLVGGVLAVMFTQPERVRDRDWIVEQFTQVTLLAADAGELGADFEAAQRAQDGGSAALQVVQRFVRDNVDQVLNACFALFLHVADDLRGRAATSLGAHDQVLQALSYFDPRDASDDALRIETARLRLRAWRASDIDDLAALCADPAVMRHFPSALSRAESERTLARLQAHDAEHGFCYFATERRDTGAFIGFIGLMRQDLSPALAPCVDIGWRLRPEAWGQGYALEGAQAVLHFAFEVHELPAVHAIAPLVNTPSLRVMERLGMTRLADFEHPALAASPTLQRCAHYRSDRETT
ncbi:MAG: GNAT family N-acetyltransferase [Planctomycetota bacterium]